ncbi:efflux RND transporter periplasmic adaptor subunit [Motilimonas eburnea]|uniref:efflux RND transporter periplasmic adaptor subunit n=1 Tax=Motilimonas eburnea TaxID=1737488 RepID=UPI001E53DEEB|nr:efflux RND transporter periplasmic adaptor subunit [Motilimonas eburnea]MCE2572938.1 efflux RND transporter periplasmic adaptor subunit [Motilimonas eburnea]
MKKLAPLSLLLVASALLLSACAEEAPATANQPEIKRPVKVSQINLADTKRSRTLPGEVQASNRAVMSFQVGGAIAEILVRPGQTVKAGTVLAKLDAALYQQQHDIAQAQYNLAKVLFNRSQELVKRGVISRNDFDKVKRDYSVAQAALDKTNNDLSYTQLVAPYDGIVAARFKEVFEFTAPKESVLTIQTDTLVDVNFQLPEQFIGMYQNQEHTSSAHPSQQPNDSYAVKVKFPSRDQWFDAHITELSTIADSTTGSYTVILRLPRPDKLNVFPGMSASVRISLPAKSDGSQPKVPASAVVKENGQDFVFRLNETQQRVEKVAVTLAEGRLVDGLMDGDLLVTVGANELQDGQPAVRWVKERGL